MDLNVNKTLYSAKGVDLNNIGNVANKILAQSSKSTKEPTIQNIDLSKFNRNTLGVNLYSSRTGVDLQKQISQIQAGLYAKSIDVSSLNSAAAQSLYSANAVQKNVELTQSVQQVELIAPKQIERQNYNIELFNIADKHSSANNFNPFKDNKNKKEK